MVVMYEFLPIAACNMCGSPSGGHKVLGRRLNRSQGLFPWSKPGVAVTVYRCRVCGLVYPNPMPVPTGVSDHYDVPPEEYWREEYFTEDPAYYSSQIDRYRALSGKPQTGLTALDIGAGIGKGMRALARAGFITYGVEPSEHFRETAIRRNTIPPEKIQHSTIEESSYPDSSFDFITFLAVLEHLFDPASILAKVVRWLRPDGLMVIEVPSADYLLNRMARWVYRLTGCDFVANLSPMHPPYHLYEFSVKSFYMHCKTGGYQIVATNVIPAPTYLPTTFRFLDRPLHWLMSRTRTEMQNEIWISRG